MRDTQDDDVEPGDEIRKALSHIGWLDGPADAVAGWCDQKWRVDAAPDAAAEALRHLSEKYGERLEEIEKLRELEALYWEVAERLGPYLHVHGLQDGSDEEIARAARLRAELGIEREPLPTKQNDNDRE